MRTYVEKTIVRNAEKDVFCDLCGKKFGHNKAPTYDKRVMNVDFIYGEWYSDCDLREGFVIEDLCLECALEIKAILEENGVKIKEYEQAW